MSWIMTLYAGGIQVTPVASGGIEAVLVPSGGSLITLVPSGGMIVTFRNPEALPEPYRTRVAPHLAARVQSPTVSSPPRDPRACSVCERSDQSYSVESVLSYGIAGQGVEHVSPGLVSALTFNQNDFDLACERDYSRALAAAHAQVQAANMPKQVVRQVVKTQERWFAGWLGAIISAITLGPVLGIITEIAVHEMSNGYLANIDNGAVGNWSGYLACFGPCLLAALLVGLRPTKVVTLETQEAAEARVAQKVSTAKSNAAQALSRVKQDSDQKKQKARALYSSLYYCTRDNIVYIPGRKTSAKPGATMYEYLVSEASQ